MNNPIIQLKDLSKCYGTKKAVDKLNLHIASGEIFGLLGPNGAGKTTSILMMLGLTEPTEGTATVCGYDATRNPLEVKKLVGYLPDNVGFYPDMTALENLCFIAQINGIEEQEAKKSAIELLQTVGLTHATNNKTNTFSRGMKQRLGLAEVLIKKPQVVILDEPTLGIDPSGVNEFLELIQKLSREQNLTVLMSSHHLHQVQRVCDRVGIFVDGKMIVEGPIETLAHQLQLNEGFKTIIQLDNNKLSSSDITAVLSEISGYKSCELQNDILSIYSDLDITADAVKLLVHKNANIISVQRNGYSLDDIYAKYFENQTVKM
ncbi:MULTISPECIES: ABC transporter ATP-binding protein [Sphingobacterium]|uniref:ABC transporter ATP-binding protein n=1 Tax=Sphingobacterium litopenaei TaxID=2763500 RepID=A0ABR7YAW3_9SPHI|nr:MULTISPECIES: ABC transporter ATP-binding protein [Sphingobacterium]MBD1428455.1 ABC transporter ATP-binding protein [Sphingobacterium litopenaei]NGM71741.1 ABC transporter ATP-binding protein [Sphingobacterium sp. SGL-16]